MAHDGLSHPAWRVSYLAVVASLLLALFPALGRAGSLAPALHPFAKGSRYWSATAGVAEDTSYGPIALAQVAVSHYIRDNLALEWGGMFGYADSKRTSGGVLGGAGLGLRWHVATRARWSWYLDALVGAVYQELPLSQDSLRFNFNLQPGGGATYRLSDTTLFQGGFRWYHLSNAGVRGKAHNLGYDGPMLYLGMLRSF
ncbi:MAG: acyloxyacyl hydrolase [Candidatus Omnitrophica bacterium]|nr:acyloxyacyl hydrolase [Candidatus Omnitrophota bacterium]